jgi:hypothetical protein
MLPVMLILHSLVGVALLGATTHQSVSLLRHSARKGDGFLQRYGSVNQASFTKVVVALYVVNVVLGALLYPRYRLDVRIPFEEMQLGWAVGLFELKEHFAGLGLGVLPLYALLWRGTPSATGLRLRTALTLTVTFIAWWAFIVGHVLNNIRGLT